LPFFVGVLFFVVTNGNKSFRGFALLLSRQKCKDTLRTLSPPHRSFLVIETHPNIERTKQRK